MIAAADPQEFIPSGRQQNLRHPGPLEVEDRDEVFITSNLVLDRFEKISINESKLSEWWMIRESPDDSNARLSTAHAILLKSNKTYESGNHRDYNSMSEDSWNWKSTDTNPALKIHKRYSDLNESHNKKISDACESKSRRISDLSKNDSKCCSTRKFTSNFHNYQQSSDFIEEELYVKQNVVVWSKGLVASGSATQPDASHVTVCSYSSPYAIKHALWCTFYCERPAFDINNSDILNKPDEPLGTALPSVCIIDSQNMRVFTADDEDFITTLPIQVKQVWSTKFGIVLEKAIEKNKNTQDGLLPTMFSLGHPLDEVCPVVAVHQGSINFIEDDSLSIVFTSVEPSICMIFDSHTGQHSVYEIKRIGSHEWLEMSGKLFTPGSSLYSSSNKLKSRVSMWEGQKTQTAGSFNSAASNTANQMPSRSHSAMAAISRCQSPTSSPYLAESPWLIRCLKQNSGMRQIDSTVTQAESTQLEATDSYNHHLNPSLCFHHLWTDNLLSTQESGPASKVFLIDDLLGQHYLCYLIPSRLQLSVIQIDYTHSGYTFGMHTSIGAKDAVGIPHLHMIALLEHGGNIVLYSGLTVVGKLHIGGALARHSPSPGILKSIAQFNSPFPRRSSLLPHCGTPVADPNFDEHLLSPVLPTTSTITGRNILQIPTSSDSCLKTQLNGLRDAVYDKITVQYSDGTYYRITLPTVASSPLVDSCLQALKCVLPKDSAMTLMTRWYASRNSPGPGDFSFEQEWYAFTSVVFVLLGYDSDQVGVVPPDRTFTLAGAAKRQRTSALGSNSDWNFLMQTDIHKNISKTLFDTLHLDKKVSLQSMDYKSNKIQINTNSILFSSIRVIHFTLHLLYEELKTNTLRTKELPFLAKFLSKLACDLSLHEYEIYYWKEFPEICNAYNNNKTRIASNYLKNAITWPAMSNKPESIMEYLYNLLKGEEVVPFSCIPDVNPRTKAIVELCGIFIKGMEISIDTFVKLLIPTNNKTELIATSSKSIVMDSSVSEKIVMLMTELSITTRDLDTFPTAINFLLHHALWQCRENPPTDWTADAYYLLQRPDLASQAQIIKRSKVETSKYGAFNGQELLPTIKQIDDTEQEDGMEDVDSQLLKMRFPEDHRLAETRRLLQSSKPVSIVLTQQPDVSDHDFLEEQEKHLYAICTRTMALPVGRGMFTLRTATPVVTEPLPVPRLCLTGKAPPRGATVELTHIDTPPNMSLWPHFHNGVSNGLRISPDAHNIDSTWIIFNKPKSTAETPMEHAGFLMALGLNGHLKNLAVMNTFDYLSKFHEMTSVGILLGLSVAFRGTCDTSITKMLSIHVEALLPPTSMELDIPQNLQVAALMGVGLVYQGSAHRHMTEVLLTEIGRPPGPEMENSVDRESYSLAAGLALGLVTLQQGGRPSGLSDLNVPDTLHYYMVGGNKRLLTSSQKDKYKVSSFQIREGSTVNLDITAPGATLALGLMYFGTGNKALADWMAPPSTQYLLDFIRPDFLMLRILARALIMWDNIEPERSWIEDQIPESIRPFCMVKPAVYLDIDYEAMNQVYCNIIAGGCFAMGLKYAGSANVTAFKSLLYFCQMFTSLTAKSIAELAGKPTIETCLNVVLLSASMVMAGTGNLEIMRIIRHLRCRVGVASSTVVTYGSHLAIHMALGLLFLGGGRYTLSNSPASVAALICAFYPKFPTHSNDNRYHLQALRHLYVLAVESRLVIPKDALSGRMCYVGLSAVYLNGNTLALKGPCLIPDPSTLVKIAVDDERYWPVVFERGRNWDQLLNLLNTSGYIEVKQRAGCLSYIEDKFGYHSQLARTLTYSNAIAWDPFPKTITSFSSDITVRHFTDHFLLPPEISSSANETRFRQSLTKAAYDCVIRDKLVVLPIVATLVKTVQDLKNSPSTLQLWQLKLICTQVLCGCISSKLISSETVLALKQEAKLIIDSWEVHIQRALHSYITGGNLIYNLEILKYLPCYVTFYDIPYRLICQASKSTDIIDILQLKNFSGDTIEKVLNTICNDL